MIPSDPSSQSENQQEGHPIPPRNLRQISQQASTQSEQVERRSENESLDRNAQQVNWEEFVSILQQNNQDQQQGAPPDYIMAQIGGRIYRINRPPLPSIPEPQPTQVSTNQGNGDITPDELDFNDPFDAVSPSDLRPFPGIVDNHTPIITSQPLKLDQLQTPPIRNEQSEKIKQIDRPLAEEGGQNDTSKTQKEETKSSNLQQMMANFMKNKAIKNTIPNPTPVIPSHPDAYSGLKTSSMPVIDSKIQERERGSKDQKEQTIDKRQTEIDEDDYFNSAILDPLLIEEEFKEDTHLFNHAASQPVKSDQSLTTPSNTDTKDEELTDRINPRLQTFNGSALPKPSVFFNKSISNQQTSFAFGRHLTVYENPKHQILQNGVSAESNLFNNISSLQEPSVSKVDDSQPNFSQPILYNQISVQVPNSKIQFQEQGTNLQQIFSTSTSSSDLILVDQKVNLQIEKSFNQLMQRLGMASKQELVNLLRFYFFQAEQNLFKYNTLINFLKSKYAMEQDSDLQEIINKSAMQINYGLHLVYVFASPLVWLVKNDQDNRSDNQDKRLYIQDFDLINYQDEFPKLVRSLKKFDKKIRYKKMVGTRENLEDIISQKPLILQFSGHGLPQKGKSNSPEDEGDLIILECPPQGTPAYLSEKTLCEMLSSQKSQIQLAYISSCYSERIAYSFFKAGAKHVIGIRGDQAVSNEAASLFSEYLYKYLFNQDNTICEAFFKAKRELSHQEGEVGEEAFKFIIIRDIDDYETKKKKNQFYQDQLKEKKHDNCWPIGPFEKGQVNDIGVQPKFKSNIARDPQFVGRAVEQYIINKNHFKTPLLTIIGQPGIGKTSVAKQLALHLEERNYFKDGILYLRMKNVLFVNDFLHALLRLIRECQSTEEIRLQNDYIKQLEERQKEIDNDSDKRKNSFQQAVVKFPQIEGEIATKVEINLKTVHRITHSIKDCEVMLFVDGVEGILERDKTDFLKVLEELFEKCKNLRLILTSTKQINFKSDNVQEQVFTIGRLDPNKSVHLFIKKAGLDLKNPNHLGQVKELLNSKDDHINIIKQLETHDLFQNIICGHPMTIELIASRVRYHSLLEVYKNLNQKSSSQILDPVVRSFQISLKEIKAQNPESIKLYSLISLLPTGMLDQDIQKLWTEFQQVTVENCKQELDWFSLIQSLIQDSLIQKKDVKQTEIPENQSHQTMYVISHPFMRELVQETNQDLDVQHKLVCNYFNDIMLEVYKKLDIEQFRDQQASLRHILIFHEANIFACLERVNSLQSRLKKFVSRDHHFKSSHRLNEKRPHQAAFIRKIKQQSQSYHDLAEKSLTHQRQSRAISVLETKRAKSSEPKVSNEKSLKLHKFHSYHSSNSTPLNKQTSLRQQEQRLLNESFGTSNLNRTRKSWKDQGKDHSADLEDQLNKIKGELGIINKKMKKKSQKQSKLKSKEMDTSTPQIENEDRLQLNLGQGYGDRPEGVLGNQWMTQDEEEQLLGMNSVIPCRSLIDYLSEREEGSNFESHFMFSKKKKKHHRQDEDSSHSPKQTPQQAIDFMNDLAQHFTEIEPRASSPRQHDTLQSRERSNTENELSHPLGQTMNQVEEPILAKKRSTSMKMERDNSEQRLESDQATKEMVNSSSKVNTLQGSSETSKSQNQPVMKTAKEIQIDRRKSTFMRIQQNRQQVANQKREAQSAQKTPNNNNQPTKSKAQKDKPNIQFSQKKNPELVKKKSGTRPKTPKINPELQQSLNKTGKSRISAKEMKSQDLKKDQNVLYPKLVHMPVEGKLILLFTSNLILNHNYDKAIRVLNNFGVSFHFQGRRGYINKLNIRKLLALAYFQSNQQFQAVESLLKETLKRFENDQVLHGIAVCCLAIAHFFFTKFPEFIDNDRNEDGVLKEALENAEKAFIYYQQIDHKIGQAFCLELKQRIRDRLKSGLCKDVQDKWEQEAHEIKALQIDLRKKQMELMRSNRSQFKQRVQGEAISLLIEISNLSYGPVEFNHLKKTKIQTSINAEHLKNNKREIENLKEIYSLSPKIQSQIKARQNVKEEKKFDQPELGRASSAEAIDLTKQKLNLQKNISNLSKYKKRSKNSGTQESNNIKKTRQSMKEKVDSNSSGNSQNFDYEVLSSMDDNFMPSLSFQKQQKVGVEERIMSFERNRKFSQEKEFIQKKHIGSNSETTGEHLSLDHKLLRRRSAQKEHFDYNSDLTFSEGGDELEGLQNQLAKSRKKSEPKPVESRQPSFSIQLDNELIFARHPSPQQSVSRIRQNTFHYIPAKDSQISFKRNAEARSEEDDFDKLLLENQSQHSMDFAFNVQMQQEGKLSRSELQIPDSQLPEVIGAIRQSLQSLKQSKENCDRLVSNQEVFKQVIEKQKDSQDLYFFSHPTFEQHYEEIVAKTKEFENQQLKEQFCVMPHGHAVDRICLEVTDDTSEDAPFEFLKFQNIHQEEEVINKQEQMDIQLMLQKGSSYFSFQNSSDCFSKEESEQQQFLNATDFPSIEEITQIHNRPNKKVSVLKQSMKSSKFADMEQLVIQGRQGFEIDQRNQSEIELEIRQQTFHEIIDIDKDGMSSVDRDLIKSLYDIYMAENDMAEKQNVKQQITDYLEKNNIKFQIIQRQISTSEDAPNFTDNINFPMHSDYYRLKNPKLDKDQPPLAAQTRALYQKQLRQNQRQNLQKLRQQLKQKDKQVLRPTQEEILELAEEQEFSESELEVAKNIDFSQSPREESKEKFHSGSGKRKSKSSFSSQQRKDETVNQDERGKKKANPGKSQKTLMGKSFKNKSLLKKSDADLRPDDEEWRQDNQSRSESSLKEQSTPKNKGDNYKSEVRKPTQLTEVPSKIKSFFQNSYKSAERVLRREPVKKQAQNVMKKSPTLTGFVGSIGLSRQIDQQEEEVGIEIVDKFHIKLNNKVSIKIVQGDITKLDTDVIVNPANIYLENKGGISGQIILNGGEDIQKQCHKWVKKYGPVSTGTCAFTKGGNLNCKYIIHTPGPIWSSYPEKKSLELLKSCVVKSLELTKKLDCGDKGEGNQVVGEKVDVRSVGIPGISMGNNNGPKDKCSRQILASVKDWCINKYGGSKVEEIVVCALDEETVDIFRQEFANLFL